MSTTHTITISLDDEEYDRLTSEARRRSIQPEALAREYIHQNLPEESEEAGDVLQRTMAALEELRSIREDARRRGYPALDAVEVVREGRRELEERSDSLWPS
ncbi:MAG TPA: hypothetical protein PKA95_14325 [Thermomicrobiales bacterium]|nr:hypothetical protein [Thermomicrobiales bacterium]